MHLVQEEPDHNHCLMLLSKQEDLTFDRIRSHSISAKTVKGTLVEICSLDLYTLENDTVTLIGHKEIFNTFLRNLKTV